MKKLSSREKSLAAIIGVTCVVGLGVFIKKQMRLKLERYEAELVSVQQQVQQSRNSIAMFRPVPQTSSKTVLTLLKDLTQPGDVYNVKIKAVDKIGEDMFKVAIEGEFQNVMKFISYIERTEGAFVVDDADMAKMADTNTDRNAEPRKIIRGLFTLSTRKGAAS